MVNKNIFLCIYNNKVPDFYFNLVFKVNFVVYL